MLQVWFVHEAIYLATGFAVVQEGPLIHLLLARCEYTYLRWGLCL
jgi:hypothetical protein